MEIRHVTDREDEGTIEDVFRRHAGRGRVTANRILELLALLREMPHSRPIWAYEGHGHCAFSFWPTAGQPVVDVLSEEPNMYTVIGTHPQPFREIPRSADVRYA